MLRPNNFKNPEAEGDENPSELFSSSPVPDRYSTPRVNLAARSVFDVEPGSGPPAPIVQPLFLEADATEVSVETAGVALETSFDHVAVEATTSTPAVKVKSRNNSPLSNSSIKSPEKPTFSVGDIVWAQTDVQFASWPALVIDPSNLPDTLQEAYHFTARNGKNSKIPVYFYGKNDYDVVLPARMKDYSRFRDTMKTQNVTGKLYVMFRRAVRLAEENLAKDAAQRTEWMIKSRTDTTAGLDPKEPYLRTNSGGSSVNSGMGSRKSSMQINTDSQEGNTIYGNAALQMSPLSDTYTAGGYTPTPGDPSRPSRFPFPDHGAPPLETVVEGIDASPAPPLDHKTTTLLETLPPLNVLGSPRRSSPANRDVHSITESADHAALMASAAEAVDRALLDNYEIVDLSPSQIEQLPGEFEPEQVQQDESAPVFVAVPEPVEDEQETMVEVSLDAAAPTIAVTTDVEDVTTSETAYSNSDAPIESELMDVSLETAEHTVESAPLSGESDIFSQLSPPSHEVNSPEDFFGSVQPASEISEPNSATELASNTDEYASARDVEGSVVSDFFSDVPLQDVPLDTVQVQDSAFDTPAPAPASVPEEPVLAWDTSVHSAADTSADVFDNVELSEPSPFDAPAHTQIQAPMQTLPPIDAPFVAAVAPVALPVVPSLPPLATEESPSAFDQAPPHDFFSAEPPRPAHLSPPRSSLPSPHQAPPSISTFSPEKPAPSGLQSPSKAPVVVARSPQANRTDASSLFGGGSGGDLFGSTVNSTPGGARADMFGAPPTTGLSLSVPPPISTSTKHNDASALFGGSSVAENANNTNEIDLFGPPAPNLPPPPTPPSQRVGSAGRPPVTATAPVPAPVVAPVVASRGPFDTAASSSDSLFGAPPVSVAPVVRAAVPTADAAGLFGAPPAGSTSAAAPVQKKVVSARLTPSASASDLFGSAPADSLFGGPSVSAAPTPPQVRPTVAHFSTSGVFGDAPPTAVGNNAGLSKKASFKNSPSRAVGDAASLFGGSAASDPFSFGAAPAAASAAASVFGPAPVQAAARTPVHTTNSAPGPFAAPPARGAVPTTAADLFGSPAGSAGGNAGDLFGAPAAPPVAAVSAPFTAPPAAARNTPPPVAAFAPAPVPLVQEVVQSQDTASFFGEEAPAVATAPTAVAPAPVPVPVTSSNPTTPVHHAQNAHDLFGAAPATTTASAAAVFTSSADTADSLFAAAADTTQTTLAPPSPLARTATAPVNATEYTLQSAALAASATAQPTLQRNVSAGPVFKGRAQVVSGASPFDAPAPASSAKSADVLFGGSSKNNSDPFGAAPAGFGNNNAFGGPAAGSADLFSAPPPGASSSPSPFAASNGSSKKVTKTPKAQLSASDVFSAQAPVEAPKPYAALVDPLCPPSAPGVKSRLSVSTSPHVNANAAGASGHVEPFSSMVAPGSPFVGDSSPATVGAGAAGSTASAVTSGASGKVRTAPVPKGKKAPPPGMIATPHGYVPIASLQNSGPNGGVAGAPNPTPEVGVGALKRPLVNHALLTSLVTEVPEEVVQSTTIDAAATFANTPVATTATVSTSATASAAAAHPTRNNRVKPTAAVVSFGFGGKLVCMTPRQHAMATYNPAYGGESVRGYYSGPVKVYNVIDVVNHSAKNGSAGGTSGGVETLELCKLLTQFPGPLATHQPATTTDPSSATASHTASHSSSSFTSEELVREALQHRIDCPLTGLLADAGGSASGVASKADPSSEKLLWSLLKLCVDRNGVLCGGGSGEDGASTGGVSAAEVRICQLLMGHASTTTAAATTAAGASMPSVSVFSGSASGAVTSYAPDMSKSALLHANFHSATTAGGAADPFKTPNAASAGQPVTADQYAEIEALLVVGRKEEALKRAILHNEWSLALLIGSVCGPDKYAEVVHSYSSSHFPKSTPLHLLTLMYADVGSSIVLNTTANSAHTTASSTTITNTSSGGDVLTLWRHNLSAILSNKPSNWQQLAAFLGYRLHTETKDIYAAHSAYLTAGAYPTFPVSSSSSGSAAAGGAAPRLSHAGSTDHLPSHSNSNVATNSADLDTLTKLAGKYSLLGCDVGLPKHRALADIASISALRGTEILEFALAKRLKSSVSAAPDSEGIASIGKSITGIFGWKSSASGSNSGAAGGSAGSVPPKSPRRGQSSAQSGAGDAGQDPAAEARLRYQATKIRVVLCPLKVRFAMVLADFGLLRESVAYALEARALVQEIGVADDKSKVDKSGKNRPPGTTTAGGAGPNPSNSNNNNSANTSGSGEPSVKPFNRHFVRALDEFIDRLGVSDKARTAAVTHKREGSTGASAATSSSSTSASSSVWSSMISSINLKDIVDMVDGPNAAATANAAPATTTAATVAAGGAAKSAPSNIWNNGTSVFDVPPIAASSSTTSVPPLSSRGSSSTLNAPPTVYSSASGAPPGPYGGGGAGGAGGAPYSSVGSAQPPHPAGHTALPAPHAANASAQSAPVPAPASAAQYAPMSSMPPRPGKMVVPPSAQGVSTGQASASAGGHSSGGGMSHSTSQGNLQQSVQGPPPATHSVPPAHNVPSAPPANGNYSGGSDFFEDIDLQSPDKQQPQSHYHPNNSQQQYNTAPGGGAGGMYGYPPNPASNAAPGAAPYTNAPYNPASNNSNHTAHSNSAHSAGSSTPPANMYSVSSHSSSNTTPIAATTATAPPATGGFFGFGGGASTATNTNSNTSVNNAQANSNNAGSAHPPATTTNSSNSTLPPRGRTPAPATTTAAPRPAADQQPSAGGGLFGSMRKGLINYLYPDAHDASDNIGDSLAAVYNKETGRWEFPGEENAAPSPSSLPPPTGMGGSGMSSGMNSSGVSPSPSMSAFGNAGIAGPPGAMGGGPPGPSGGGGGGGDSGAYDPMAALMAPPSRRMPSSYSTPSLNTAASSNADADPLAAMMAPPSSRYSLPHASSTMSMSTMPQINVWKPPPVAAAAAAPVVMPVVYDESSDNANANAAAGDHNTGSNHYNYAEGPPSGALPPPPM